MTNHPLYIAPDEEIISVIARLRTLPESEVTLVFPKHSVVTQSIINLKLLAREGEKLQKKLTLVSQNENARSLAEKIGFATLPYTQEMEKGNLYLQGETSIEPPAPSTFIAENAEALKAASLQESSIPKPKSTQIGSQNFYQKPTSGISDVKPSSGADAETLRIQPTPLSEVVPPQPAATSLRVRNMTPERPPSLNSTRYKEGALNDISTQSTVSSPIFPDSYEPVSAAPVPSEPRVAPIQPSPVSPKPAPSSAQPTAIHNFFNRSTESTPPAPIRMPEPAPAGPAFTPFVKKAAVPKKRKEAPTVMVGKSVSNKLSYILGALVVLLILAGGAIGFFLIFPSATVTVHPQTITDSYDQSFTVSTQNGTAEVPLQKATQELTVTVAGIASGAADTATSAGTRATGKIKITNNFSSEAQPLLATTRFESNTGKIYRIQENVTVPGNGSIEATVVADGSGESYNLNDGSLTIPGLKGTDKYGKINATVVSPITGGGGTEAVSGGTFIKADEETLRTRAQDEAKRMFSESVDNEKNDIYTFVDGLQIERVTETGLPKVGSVPGEYEYSAVFKVTAYATSKESVTNAILKNIRSEYDGITFAPAEKELSFTDFTLNKENTEASLKAHLETTLAANIEEQKIKADLRGKAASDLKNFTTAHPEIKSLSIMVKPSWALKRIPSNPNKIHIKTELEQE